MPTLITTSFSASSTAAEVLDGVDLTGRRMIVTGGASGIGVETARALAAAGAAVTLAVRDVSSGQRVAADITATTGNAAVDVGHLDLADPDSVRAFVDGWDGPLHALIGNAGVMASPQTYTADGWELQFATNHLGHFALATGLHGAMSVDGARLVSVSSTAHLRSPVVFDDVHFRERAYEPWLAYGQSKTANVLFAVEAARRWAADGIVANALNPGGIRTGLQRHLDEDGLAAMNERAATGGFVWKTPEQGAATSVLLAASPLTAEVSGRYFEDCNEAAPVEPGGYRGVAAYALDPEAAAHLWTVSEETLAAR